MKNIPPKVSIIVPVYNAETYLHLCVGSLLGQTLSNFEILLIDDGSLDKSGEICDEYVTKDSRIRVFHKENGGVASARQCGIDNAIGEYTIHADPDDWVEPTMIEELYNTAKEEHADMVICDFYKNQGNKQYYISQHPKCIDAPTILCQILSQQLHGSCCNKLVKRSLYSKYEIAFPHNISLWEDFYINCRLLMQDIRVAYLGKAFYHYVQHTNTNSITHTPSTANIRSLRYVINWFDQHLPTHIYASALFMMKASCKEQAFHTKLPPQYIKKLYSEINSEYLTNRKGLNIRYGVILCIRGYNRYARCLQRLLPIIVWCKRRLIN